MQVNNGSKKSSYKELIVWQKSIDLVIEVYKLTEKLPKQEQYGLTSQIRRAAVSIPSNIVEGSRRRTEKDFSQFLSVAFGSGSELETQLEIGRRLDYLSGASLKKASDLLEEIMKILNTMLTKRSAY